MTAAPAEGYWMMYCGVDEAGRGPMVGPLVVGAVWSSDPESLRRIGARDSKQLSPSKRAVLFREIEETADHWTVVTVPAARLDEMMAVKNLNEIETDLFAEASRSYPCDELQVDCPEVNTQRFGLRLSQMIGGIPVDARNKADVLFPCVSAASIMAKVTRDRMIEEIERELGTDVGSGYPSDPVTRAYVEDWINKHHSVPPYTRGSWKPVKDLLMKRSVRTLDDW